MDIRVAVTGATGFLGKALTRRLVAGMKGVLSKDL
jgi:nucleoside-diphosphate-sugar epimerase